MKSLRIAKMNIQSVMKSVMVYYLIFIAIVMALCIGNYVGGLKSNVRYRICNCNFLICLWIKLL